MKWLSFWFVLMLFHLRVQAQDSAPEPSDKRLRPGLVTTLAGATKQVGSRDGAGSEALFNRPMGIALAADGTLYVADTNNHTIRQITAAGVVSTLAGAVGSKGSLDGTGAAARFNQPIGIALDAQGTLYVTDGGNHTIRKVTPAGVVTTLAGQAGKKGNFDGTADEARFQSPHGIAVALDGSVYVADTENHTVRHLTSAGVVTTLAGTPGRKGAADGAGTQARFFHPSSVAVDSNGVLYIVDNGNHTVRKVTAAGEVSTLAGTAGKRGTADGLGTAARFDWPNGVAVDSQGRVYVADNVNSTVRCILATGEVTTLAGTALRWGSQDGKGTEARFEFPFGVAVNPSGTKLYLTDTKNQLIRCVQ